MPSADTLKRRDGAHSNNPHVREAVLKRKEAQHVAWAYQRGKDYSNGRGFGFTGGHNHVNWGSDNFRKLVLNGIAWIAKAEIPSKGVSPGEVSVTGLQENQDYPPRGWTPNKSRPSSRNSTASHRKKVARTLHQKPPLIPTLSLFLQARS